MSDLVNYLRDQLILVSELLLIDKDKREAHLLAFEANKGYKPLPLIELVEQAAAHIGASSKLIEEHNHRMSLIPSVERSTDPTENLFILANWFDAYYREYGDFNAQPQKDLRDLGLSLKDQQKRITELETEATHLRAYRGTNEKKLKQRITELESQLAALKERADKAEWFAEQSHLYLECILDRECGAHEYRVIRVQFNEIGKRLDIYDDYFEFETIVKGCDTAEDAIAAALKGTKE